MLKSLVKVVMASMLMIGSVYVYAANKMIEFQANAPLCIERGTLAGGGASADYKRFKKGAYSIKHYEGTDQFCFTLFCHQQLKRKSSSPYSEII